MKVRYRINGKEVSRKKFLRHKVPYLGTGDGRGIPGIAAAYSRRPVVSVGLGCTRKQVPEFNRRLEAAGITGAHHAPNGDLVIETRQARNEVLKMRNMRDCDAGYGDWAGVS